MAIHKFHLIVQMESGTPNSWQQFSDVYKNGAPEDRERIRVVIVLGLTGVGKSAFIDKLTNDHNIVIGHELYSRE